MIESIINSNKKIYLGAVSANSTNTAEIVRAVCMISSTKGIICYTRTTYLYVRSFIIASDGSISYGTERDTATSSTYLNIGMVYANSQDKVMLFYSKVNGGQPVGCMYKVLTVEANNTITISEEKIFYSTSNYVTGIAACYNPNMPGIHVIFQLNVSSTYYLRMRLALNTDLLTISPTSTTIKTIGATACTFDSDSMCYDDSADRVVIGYKSGTTLNGIAIAVPSSTTNTAGAETIIQTGITSVSSVLFDSKRSRTIFTSRKDNNCNYIPTTLAASVFTVGTPVATTTPTTYYLKSAYDQTTGRILTVAGDGTGNAYNCFIATPLTNGGFGFSKTKSLSNATYVPYIYNYKNTFSIFSMIDGETTKLRYIKIS